MARYIDADALLERFDAEAPMNWNDTEAEIQENTDFMFYRRIVENAPTADVVPKAEFDALDAECSRLERLEEEYCFGRPKAIQEMVEKLKKRLPVISPCIFDNIAKEVLEEQQDAKIH